MEWASVCKNSLVSLRCPSQGPLDQTLTGHMVSFTRAGLGLKSEAKSYFWSRKASF